MGDIHSTVICRANNVFLPPWIWKIQRVSFGKTHSITHPAVELVNGNGIWFLFGVQLPPDRHHRCVQLMKRCAWRRKNKTLLRFMTLCRSREFAESFYAEGGMGRRWDHKALLKVCPTE